MDEFELEIKTAFLDEARSLLEDAESAFLSLEQAASSGSDSHESIERIFRLAHHFKGSASAVGFTDLATLAHRMEDVLSAIRQEKVPPCSSVVSILLLALDRLKNFVHGLKGDLSYVQDDSQMILSLEQAARGENLDCRNNAPQESVSAPRNGPGTAPSASPVAEEESIRVNTRKLDQLLNRVGELVVNQSILDNHRRNGSASSEHALQTVSYMEKIVSEIQDISMSLRMVPIRPLFSKMNRIVREVATAQNKQVAFITEGDHVEIDKLVLERMMDPLTHLIRNAVDHGIESPEDRSTAGKQGQATVVLQAAQVNDRIAITVMDDGRGLSPEKLRKKAIEKGLIAEHEILTDEESYALIFRPGFSTKDQITDISGRGVGLDVVQQSVTDLKGTIDIKTRQGQGTGFVISLPLSLSIIPGLVVRTGSQLCVLPVSQLTEIIETAKFRHHTSTGTGRMIQLRGDVIPVLSVRESLRIPEARKKPGAHAIDHRNAGVITLHRGKKFCFSIDEILGQQQVVIKKLGSEIEGIPGVLGGAILSSGDPALIIDLHGLIPERSPMRSNHAAA